MIYLIFFCAVELQLKSTDEYIIGYPIIKIYFEDKNILSIFNTK